MTPPAQPAPMWPPLLLAAMALGFVYGHDVPAMLGHPAAIWDRLATLATPAIAIIALTWAMGRRREDAPSNSWYTFGVAAAVALTMHWQAGISIHAGWWEVQAAAWLYGAVYVGLQAVLTWLWWELRQSTLAEWRRLNGPRWQVPDVAMTVAVLLCAFGTVIAVVVHLKVVDPALTSPWHVPASNAKIAQLGMAHSLGVVEQVMLVAACLPLAWWLLGGGWRLAVRTWRPGASSDVS
jgi:hypothetical protein